MNDNEKSTAARLKHVKTALRSCTASYKGVCKERDRLVKALKAVVNHQHRDACGQSLLACMQNIARAALPPVGRR